MLLNYLLNYMYAYNIQDIYNKVRGKLVNKYFSK